MRRILFMCTSRGRLTRKYMEEHDHDLKGSHYRVNDNSGLLRESLNARGVPTYIIIDRDGKQVYHSTVSRVPTR